MITNFMTFVQPNPKVVNGEELGEDRPSAATRSKVLSSVSEICTSTSRLGFNRSMQHDRAILKKIGISSQETVEVDAEEFRQFQAFKA